ncbi:MAG TPA: PfkB family carbohydrate kinase [Kiritimatiellia bacterium]|nr:PfkB family carbohydrate kinase [Kiritimatiellia bacterium]HOM59296.1 PfkB family carbohydrate kinase [Kiritimatiellia bacterium]HOR98004.1 PfkB family carbohydrate kinase [Kiritimatiellia bacterium]HPK37256.1 PfkB family carbohydrate kinase [Kiritimatiellia bacterium]
MKKVLCLGLSPVLQRTLRFDRLTPDEVNRARQVMESAAGKALNTARALVTLGTPAITAGFNGGASGARVTAMLKQCGVGDAMTTMPSPTRLCTTLLDDHAGTVTELVEEAPAPGRTALRRFIADNLSRIPGAALLAISGTLPPFAKDDFYVAFVRAARAAGVPVVIDSHRTALIQVLFEQPLLAKLNVAELEATLGEKLNTEARILRGMRDLLNLGAANVFVTQGSRAAYLLTPRAAWRFTPPAIRERVNPIGSGDCTTAGIVHALLRGKRLPDAVRLGLACGSANAETLTPGTFDARRARALCRTVTCEPRMVRETVPQKN